MEFVHTKYVALSESQCCYYYSVIKDDMLFIIIGGNM